MNNIIYVEFPGGKQFIGKLQGSYDNIFANDCINQEDIGDIPCSAFVLISPVALVQHPQAPGQVQLIKWVSPKMQIYKSSTCGITDEVEASIVNAYIQLTTGLVVPQIN